MRTLKFDVRVDAAKYATVGFSRAKELDEIEAIISAALRGRGYFDVDVIAAPAEATS